MSQSSKPDAKIKAKTVNVEVKKSFNLWQTVKESAFIIYWRILYLLFIFLTVFFNKQPVVQIVSSKKEEEYKKRLSAKNLRKQYKRLIYSEKIFDKTILQLLQTQYYAYNFENFRINYRLNFFKKGFYMLYTTNTNHKNFIKTNLNFFYSGLGYFFSFFSKWFLPLTLLVVFVYYSLIIKSLPFNKVLFVWTALFMVFYWIVSGFVFFFKKYQYSKFTSVIQRFWKRALILFWVLEGALLLVFIFLTINSGNYLYNVVDQTQIFKTHLFSWRLFLLKVFPLTFLLLLTYLFLLNNKWQPLNKNLPLLIIITFLLLYIVWVEFYQYYHIMNYYGALSWDYEPLVRKWVIKTDLRKTSQTNHLVSLLLILKFWHVLFVAAVWFFFVLRSDESDRARYPLISANFLNFVMLYLLTWVYMYPWFKWFFRRYFTYSYKWFYQNNRTLSPRLFFNDLKLFYFGVLDLPYVLNNYLFMPSFKHFIFFDLKTPGFSYGFVDFKKKFVSNQIFLDLVNINQNLKTENFFIKFSNLIKDLGWATMEYFFYELRRDEWKLNDWFVEFELELFW